MPSTSLKFFKLFFLLVLVFILNLPFLMNPQPARATFDVCIDANDTDKAELTIDPDNRVVAGTRIKLSASFYVNQKPPAPNHQYPDITWKVWQGGAGSSHQAVITGGSLWTSWHWTIPITLTTKATDVDSHYSLGGDLIHYEGFVEFNVPTTQGEYNYSLVDPQITSDVKLGDQIACLKSVSFTVTDSGGLVRVAVPSTLSDDASWSPDSGTGHCSTTAIGISTCPKLSEFVNRLLSIAIGSFGGIAFLLLIYGGIRLVASQGDPKALQEARGVITAAITGLLFAIFAVFILRLLGIGILGLPL